jgi:transitional endoplasmic reticulum ATPase
MHQNEDSLRQYDKAWEIEGGRDGKPAFPAHPGQVPFSRSAALVELKRWKEALEAVEDSLYRDPDNALYHNRKSVILYDGLHLVEEAAEAAERAIALDPETISTGNDGIYYYNLAHYLEKLNRNGDALEAIDRAIDISPQRSFKEYRKKLLGVAQKETTAEPPASPRINFSRVGGMKALKEQVRRIVNVIHNNRDDAERYGIVRNGILLYGPPGCGKSFFAEAIAGEFSLNFMRIELSSALSKYVGSAGETMEKLFHKARETLPCVLFLDELDTLAGRRSDSGSQHEQQTVNALLQQIDIHRDIPGLVLVAATNRLDEIDPAAIREGRFDYKVKIYKPDFDARREILDVLLQDRPHDGSVDTTRLAQNMEGFSAAQLRHVVDEAALAAMEAESPISDGHLQEAYNRHITKMRYQGVRLTWDGLVLPEEKKRKLQFIEKFIENPDVARKLGIEAPRGVLLFGPPGTGKTTIARVLASETDASFFAVNAADIFSKWLGESEQHVKELFEKARDNVPALLFIDEIEAVLGRRSEAATGGGHARNAVINTFLSEMDGMESNGRIFVIGATNRPELLDEAALRPGRLSEAIEIGLPNREARLAMLRLFTEKMSLDDGVDLPKLAEETEGASGADLKGLCTAAGRNAFLRALEEEGGEPAVTPADFGSAVEQLFPESAWRKEERKIGFT